MLKRHVVGLFGVLLLAGGAVHAQEFEEDTHYRVLERPQSTMDDERIEVREFFSYACPYCHQFYPIMQDYIRNAPDDVMLVHHPVVFRDDWEVLARAYFVADELDVVDEVHGPIFVAYHEENQRLGSLEDAQELFTRYADVEADDVADAWESFGVETSLRRYDRAAQAYGVSGTPAVAVNGKYYTDGRLAGSFDNMVRIIEYLVEQERQAAR